MVEEKKSLQKLNFEIDHSKEAFYSNDFGVIHKLNEVVLDFRQALQRLDVLPTPDGGNNAINSVSIKHNPIVTQLSTLKMFYLILKEQIEKIEREQGEIKLPEKWKAESKAIESKRGELSYIG